jgi:hypothetical protein
MQGSCSLRHDANTADGAALVDLHRPANSQRTLARRPIEVALLVRTRAADRIDFAVFGYDLLVPASYRRNVKP